MHDFHTMERNSVVEKSSTICCSLIYTMHAKMKLSVVMLIKWLSLKKVIQDLLSEIMVHLPPSEHSKQLVVHRLTILFHKQRLMTGHYILMMPRIPSL